MKDGFEGKLLDVLERINSNLEIMAKKMVERKYGTEFSGTSTG